MPKRKVTGETVAKILQLRRRGMNDSEIGRELDLDRRTVRSAVDKIGKVIDHEHWQSVNRDVDAELLKRHYGDLIRLVVGIQEQIAHDELLTSATAFKADSCIRLSFTKVFGHDSSAVGEIEHQPDLAHYRMLEPLLPSRANPMGELLLEALREHEPGLMDALDDWSSKFDELQREKQLLAEGARNLLLRRRIAGIDVDLLVDYMVREIHARAFRSSWEGSFRVVPRDSSQVSVYREVPYVLDEQVFTGTENETDEFRKSYEEVLEDVGGEDQLKLVTQLGLRELSKRRENVDRFVNILILRGRPSGRCEICPYALL